MKEIYYPASPEEVERMVIPCPMCRKLGMIGLGRKWERSKTELVVLDGKLMARAVLRERVCPKCKGAMRIEASEDDKELVRRRLKTTMEWREGGGDERGSEKT